MFCFLGSATTVASNPFWVIQTTQTSSHTLTSSSNNGSNNKTGRRLGFFETINRILRKDGLGAFWRGLGPALVLVINPVLQYTVFEQLKNVLIKRRTAQLRASSKAGHGVAAAAAAVAILTDVDYFFLGALAKLGTFSWAIFVASWICPPSQHVEADISLASTVSTALTYPYMCVPNLCQRSARFALTH